MPTASDLVTDLPADFETFGQAVATSMADLLGGTTGQVLSKASNTDMDFTWVAQDDSNAIQNAIVDAKGDLIAASAADTPARLAVGNNGETLVADSSTSTGLSYQANWAAGKNKIINGDFRINQRNFTSGTSGFVFDRLNSVSVDGTVTVSAQTFTPGAAPVAGYEAVNFARIITTGQTLSSAQARWRYFIEDVRTLAGQTATFSFWAKAATGTPSFSVQMWQNFGAGGSPEADFLNQKITISTSWTRYSITIAVPSISGKTIGTSSLVGMNLWTSAGSNFSVQSSSLGIQSNTIDIWGLQFEAGSVATAFQTATGTIQGELAACQRYYYRVTADRAYSVFGAGFASSTTVARVGVPIPVTMRVQPTSVEYSSLSLQDYSSNWPISSTDVGTNTDYGSKSFLNGAVAVSSGLTQFRPYNLIANNSTSAYIGWSAEL